MSMRRGKNLDVMFAKLAFQKKQDMNTHIAKHHEDKKLFKCKIIKIINQRFWLPFLYISVMTVVEFPSVAGEI